MSISQTLIFNKKKCFKTSDEPCDPASMTFLSNWLLIVPSDHLCALPATWSITCVHAAMMVITVTLCCEINLSFLTFWLIFCSFLLRNYILLLWLNTNTLSFFEKIDEPFLPYNIWLLNISCDSSTALYSMHSERKIWKLQSQKSKK